MISKIFLRFDAELKGVVSYAKAHHARLKISAEMLAHLEADLKLWATEFALYQDAATRTSGVTYQVRLNYEAIESYLRRFQGTLKRNPDVTLSGEDYKGLHIHVNLPHRQHVPRPTIAPQIDLLGTSHLRNEFEITDPNRPEQNHRAFPPDIAAAGRKLAVVPAGTTPTAADYVSLSNTGRTLFSLNFEPSQVGQQASLICWYMNSRGETGPPSKPLSFLIV